MVIITWLVAVEPGTVNQKFVLLKSTEFVCKLQPVWSAGHDRSNCVPATTATMLALAIRSVPSLERG
jgi:hypothetical protein